MIPVAERSSNTKHLLLWSRSMAGKCIIKTSRTAKNLNREFLACPNAINTSNGCGLWIWMDEFRICDCRSGPCQLMTSNQPNPVGRRFYCCPRSTNGNTGCGYFKWFEDMDAGSSSTKKEKVMPTDGPRAKNIENMCGKLETEQQRASQVADLARQNAKEAQRHADFCGDIIKQLEYLKLK